MIKIDFEELICFNNKKLIFIFNWKYFFKKYCIKYMIAKFEEIQKLQL